MFIRDLQTNMHLAILCDLFGMVKLPFQRLNGLQIGDKKVTLNHLAVHFVSLTSLVLKA